MKSDEELVAIALKIAENNPFATVMVALRTYPEAKHFLSLARFSPSLGAGTLKMQGMAVDFPSGGKVFFRNVGKSCVADCAGYQLTHLFVPRSIHLEAEAFLKSRIRSPKKDLLLTPMGVYKPYWVERWHTYKEIESKE